MTFGTVGFKKLILNRTGEIFSAGTEGEPGLKSQILERGSGAAGRRQKSQGISPQ
ncbi:hypothetical protein [Methanosarcina sp. MSH10X1]|uniref:hypothetical protein n=1 Tax=Methanosarcina sp. MSH10X1 TaxID=2507075 RepID=UPI0013E350CA|nr:hypothetical protein [Methanosarcina sp. MSH10X1]